MEKVKLIWKTFADFNPMPLEMWVNGFRSDMYPDKEIHLWLHAVKVFKHFTAHLDPSEIDKRNDIYKVIITCSTCRPEHVARVVPEFRTLSKKRVQAIINYYFSTYWPGE